MAFNPPAIGRHRARLLHLASFGEIEVAQGRDAHFGAGPGEVAGTILSKLCTG